MSAATKLVLVRVLEARQLSLEDGTCASEGTIVELPADAAKLLEAQGFVEKVK